MTETINPAGAMIGAALVDDDLALVAGWSERLLPGSGELKIGGQHAGSARIHSWPRMAEGGESHWFVAVIAGPEIMRLGGTATLTSPNKRMRYELQPPRPSLDCAGLITELATLAQGEPGLLTFLEEVLLEQPTPRRSAALFALFEKVVPLDGYLELLGHSEGALVIQGWSMHLSPGRAELVVESGRFDRLTAAIATHDRPDLGSAGRGMVAVLPGATVDWRGIRRVFFRKAEGWHRLEVFENRRFLSEAETSAHLAGILPALRMEPAVAALFKRLGGPRFEGFETLSSLAAPVRAAIDLAVGTAGSGVFLTGWLLDPERRVTAVRLRNSANFSQRIDEAWHRSDRPDVSTGYGADPLFAGRILPGDDAHGFLVSVPCACEPVASWFLELQLDDERTAFLPVPVTPPTQPLVRRMLTSLDIRGAATAAVIAGQLGPMVTAASARLPRAKRCHVASSFGRSERKPHVTAIIPVPVGTTDIDVTLARFAVDPELTSVEILAVAPPGSAAALGASLQRAARFYGLFGRMVVTTDHMDPCEALEAGAAFAEGELLLFLSAGVLPRGKGWLSRLGKPLFATEAPGAVCPTLLWEDESIKFAGQHTTAGAVPSVERTSLTRFAGYARHWLPDEGGAPVQVQVGTIECCLIPKRVFAAMGGFARDYVGAEWKGPDFFLRLRAAGYSCLWVPTVEMVALDDPAEADEPEYWRQTGRLVDEWGFDRKWATPMAVMERN